MLRQQEVHTISDLTSLRDGSSEDDHKSVLFISSEGEASCDDAQEPANSQVDFSQSRFLQSFNKEWLRDGLAFGDDAATEKTTSNEPERTFEKIHDNAVQSTRHAVHKKPPSKCKEWRPPKTKFESLREVLMLIDESIAVEHPLVIRTVESLFQAAGIDQDQGETAKAPQVCTAKGCGEHTVRWHRRPWFLGPPPMLGSKDDPLEVFSEPCPFKLYLVPVDSLAEDLHDFQLIERAIATRFKSRSNLVFLAVTGIRSMVSQRRAQLNRRFLEHVSTGAVPSLKLGDEDEFWTDWESRLFRMCMRHGVHLMTRFRRSEAESECPSYLLVELSKAIAWEPYHGESNAGLSFSAVTTGRKAADNKSAVWKRWLLELPRMSAAAAEAVAAKWPSYAAFATHFSGVSVEQAMATVAAAPVNANRLLGPALATRICTHFLQTHSDG